MSTSSALAGLVSADILAAHLQEIIVEYDSYRKQFRRADNREPVAIPVEAVELDYELRPISKPFHMVTRDMSVSGAGILHTADINSQYLRLQFSSPVTLEAFGVIAKVEHCTPCGHYFIIGCRFLSNYSQRK